MTDAFLDALRADGPAPDRAGKMDLYGQFAGSWDLDVTEFRDDGTTRTRPGEWHFGWALEGRAIQDVWIVPPRRQRAGDAAANSNRYGTTLRVYDPRIDAWQIQWTEPVGQTYLSMIGRAQGKDIVQLGKNAAGQTLRWGFYEITRDSFLWRGEASADAETTGNGWWNFARGVSKGGSESKIPMTHHHVFETELGFAAIGWSDDGITRFRLPYPNRASAEEQFKGNAEPQSPPPHVAAVVAQAERYFAGERIDFTPIELDLTGVDPMRRTIYDALRKVGFGETVTYGELAKRAGVNAPQAAQDVGVAMARNPVPLIIPCHRVLAAGGKLGGFSAPGRTETKEKMLALEGVFIGNQPKLL